MEIFKTKKGELRYREMFWTNGIAIKSPVFRRKTDCKDWMVQQLANKAQTQIHGQQRKLYQRITLADYCEKWISAKTAQDSARSTLKNYESYIRVHFIPFFKNKDIKEIEKSDVQEFQIELRKSHNAKGTNLIIGALKSIFKEAIRDEYLTKSPCEHIKTLRLDPKVDEYWSKEDINRFLQSNYDNELYDVFLFAMNTGMRKGEIAGLCWDRVDFENRIIYVTRTRDRFELKERTKTRLMRPISMNDEVYFTLQNIKKRNLNNTYVFTNKKGEEINPHHLYRRFHQAQRNAGMTKLIRFHSLRHTYASAYVNSGRSIYSLQKLLGHTDIKMTERYSHHSIEALHESMRGFSLGKVNDQIQSESTTNIIDLKDRIIEQPNQNLTIDNFENVILK